MRLLPGTAAALALCALAVAGCGVGPGGDAGSASLTVTRDYGAQPLVTEDVGIRESDTVLRVLDRSAEVETRFGGGFVQSIDGLSGGQSDGRRSDWFFYVNGIESGRGSAEFELADADRVWWDYRDWSTAMRVPAVVGSWPEPFVHGYADEDWSVGVFCGGARGPCAEVNGRLEAEGVDTGAGPEGGEAAVDKAAGGEAAGGEVRVLVGTWDAVRPDPDAALLRGGPDRSGVFATFSGSAPSVGITLLDERGRVAGTLGARSGLVAALRPGNGPPTWVVTGTDAAGLAAAVNAFGEALRDHYAVAVEEGAEPIPLPVR